MANDSALPIKQNEHPFSGSLQHLQNVSRERELVVSSLEKTLRGSRGAARVDALHKLADALSRINNRRALELIEEARSILERLPHGGTARQQRRLLLQEARNCFIAGALLLLQGKPAEAREPLEKAVGYYESVNDEAGMYGALTKLGKALARHHELEKAQDILHKCEHYYRDSADESGRAETLTLLAETYCYTGALEEAVRCSTQSLEICQTLQTMPGLASATSTRAFVYWHEGDYRSAIQYYRESLAIREQLGYRTGLISVLNSVGVMLQQFGDHAGAQEHYYRAMAISEELGQPAGVALALRNLGVSDDQLLKHESALRHYRKALAINEELGLISEQVVLTNNIGNVYKALQRFKESIDWYERSAALARACKDKRSEALAIGNIGQGYLNMGEGARGEPYMAKAVALFEELKEPWGIALTKAVLGVRHIECERYSEAKELFLDIVEKASAIKAHDLLGRAYKSLVSIFEKTEKYADALRYFRLYHENYKKIFSEQSDERIRKLETEHDVQQKEKEKEIFRLKSEKLAAEVESQQKELTAKAMYLAQNNKLLQQLKKELHSGDRSIAAGQSSNIKKVVATIDSTLEDAQTWEAFEAQFQSVHPDFVKRLVARYPELSPTEVKVCTLLMLNLSTKECARILNISSRSVGEYRYRIRKKLVLGSGDNLANALNSL